jgi:thymidine kinase
MAELIFKVGAMNSSKSAQLLMKAHDYEQQGKKSLLFKPSLDTRDEGVIRSRVGIERECILVDENVSMYCETFKSRPDVVLVDEVQFMNKDMIFELTEIVDKLEVPVVAYGIKNDFMNELFEGAKLMLVYADHIEDVFENECSFCKKKAVSNMRINNGVPVFEGDQVDVGGNDKYVPVCRSCYKKHQQGLILLKKNR